MNDALLTLSLTAATAGLLVFGGILVHAVLTRYRSVRKLDTALTDVRTAGTQAAAPAGTPLPVPKPRAQAQQLQQQVAKVGQRWIDTGLGQRIVTEEDRRLLEECGYYGEQARTVFGGTRILLPPFLCVLGVLYAGAFWKAMLWGLPASRSATWGPSGC